MYILYYKQLYIVKEEVTKNRTHQTYRGRQVAMCEDEKTLLDYIKKQPHPNDYYIEKQPER